MPATSPPSNGPPRSTSPLDEIYDALAGEVQERMLAAGDDRAPDLSPVAARMLAVPPARLHRPDDAARFIHLLGFLSRQPGTDGRRAWAWAKQAAAPHTRSSDVLGLLAALGDQLRQVDPAAADAIPPAELADLFRRSMALAPDRPTAFGRAGLFFLHGGDDVQAERCLTRAFDLDPTSAFIAQQLADLLDHGGRSADGLAVLDRCLSAAPVAVPDVLWKAGLAATALDRPAAAADYLGRLEQADPGRRWAAYYRAVALLGLGRFADAALAIEREAGLIQMPAALHVHAVRAAAAAGLNDAAAVRRHVDAAVRVSLSTVDYLPAAGVIGCFTRLWAAAAKLDADDTVKARLLDRLLSSGLTPPAVWADARRDQPAVPGLTRFLCDVHQPLDPTWSAAGHALPAPEPWPAYRVRYAVLAADAAEATRVVSAWQARSASSPAVVERLTADGGPTNDRPGVVERGYPARVDR